MKLVLDERGHQLKAECLRVPDIKSVGYPFSIVTDYKFEFILFNAPPNY